MSEPTQDGTTGTGIDEAELRERLTPEQYQVTRCSATEAPFTGAYWNTKTDGTYHCVVCDAPLYRSDAKYDSGTGWPSFWEPVSDDAVSIRIDESHGMVREELVCSQCGSHIGHRFPDGPAPTGLRHCTNSASLRLDPA